MTWMRLWRGPRRSHAASVRQSRCARSRTTPTNPKTECLVSVDQATIGQVFRENSGRSVAALIRVFGDIDVAEDAVQEAFTVALRRWPTDGLPPSPGRWITTTARNRARDRLRREVRERELLGHAGIGQPQDYCFFAGFAALGGKP